MEHPVLVGHDVADDPLHVEEGEHAVPREEVVGVRFLDDDARLPVRLNHVPEVGQLPEYDTTQA